MMRPKSAALGRDAARDQHYQLQHLADLLQGTGRELDE
jgi:hypothetical protein